MKNRNSYKEDKKGFERDYYKEAIRYFKNAKVELKKAPIKKGFYEDLKHVRGACSTAYMAVLFAINGFLLQNGVPKKELPKDFKQILASLKKFSHKDGKVVDLFYQIYKGLHIQGYYIGESVVEVVKEYLSKAKTLIEKLSGERI